MFSAKIFCLVGPSGVGKTTLTRLLTKIFQEEENFHPLKEIVSVTTREPRVGEVDGVDYHFITPAQAKRHLDDGDFLEHVEYHGNTYGFLHRPFTQGLSEDANLICVVERHGLAQIAEKFPDRVVSILLLPPNLEALRSRLEGGGRTPEEVEKRLTTVEQEMDPAGFNHVVVNDTIAGTMCEMVPLIRKASTTRGDV